MMRQLRRLFSLVSVLAIVLVVVVGGLAVAVVYGVQTPWGADRIAAILRGWGYPVDRFRVGDLGWDRAVIDDIVIDGGALSLDRLEVDLLGIWPQLPGGMSGPDPMELGRVAVTGLRVTAEILSDGTIRIPAMDTLHDVIGDPSGDRDGSTGAFATVDDLSISDARIAVKTPFGDLALAMNGGAAIRPGALRVRLDGQTSLTTPESGGELGTGQFEVALDRDPDGGYGIDVSATGINTSGTNAAGINASGTNPPGIGAMPLLEDGSLWIAVDAAPDLTVSRLAFRAEGNAAPSVGGAGPVSGRVSGDIGRHGLRAGLDIAIGTARDGAGGDGTGDGGTGDGGTGRPAWLTVEGRASLNTVRGYLPAGVLSSAMTSGESGETDPDRPADGTLNVAMDGAVANWPQTHRVLSALAPGVGLSGLGLSELDLSGRDGVPADLTAAVRSDLALRVDHLPAAVRAVSADGRRPTVVVAAIADAVIDGMIGVDAGWNRSRAVSQAEAGFEPTEIRGAFRLHRADGGMAVTVVEPASIAGIAAGTPFQARFGPASTVSFRSETETVSEGEAEDISGVPTSQRPEYQDTRRFAVDGDLSLNLAMAEASIDSGEDGIAFRVSVPETMDGIEAFETGDYSLLAPSLLVDVAPLIEATTGALGLELEPVSIAIGGQGRLARPSARATIRSSAAVDRSDVMAGAQAEATVEISADPVSGTVSIRQDGCATVSIVDMAIPDGLRLAAPLELCLELETDGDRLTFRPASGYWPREALQFRVGDGEIELTGWGGDADSAVVAWPSLSMAFLRGDAGSGALEVAGEDSASTEEGSTGPSVFRVDLGDATVDLGSELGVIDGVGISMRASGETVNATLSGSWMTGVLGRRQRYALQSNLSSADGGRGDVRVAGPAGMPVVTASGRYEAATGRLIADWRLQSIDLSTIPDPSALIPALGAVAVSEQRGRISARGRLVWDGTLGASGTVDIADVGFATPFGSLSGLSTSLRVDRILPLPLAIPAGQSVSVESVDLGFVLENGAFGFGLSGDTVRIDDLRFSWAGGTVSAQPIATRLGDSERVVVLEVDSVGLAALLDDVPAEGLSITGSVSGRIPLRLTNDTVYIDDGVLISDGPGRLSYDGDAESIPGAEDAPSDGGGMDILFRALENFRYERLTMTLDGQTGYNLELGLTIEGANPDLYDGYPVKLNVGVSGALDEMLRQGLETTRIGQEAEDLLREYDGELDDDELLRRLRDLER